MKHSERLEWTRDGLCKYRVYKSAPCPGVPGYEPRKCDGHWTDEYGSSHSCRECGGSGTVRWWEYIRVPEFDAPKPKKGWTPKWVES